MLARGVTKGCNHCKIITHGESKTVSGTKTREWVAWQAMITRCAAYSPDAKDYIERGIAVCDEWKGPGGYERFLDHVGRKPTLKHSLDRIDNSKGYVPGNVRWATWSEQHRNRRSNRMVEIDEESLCVIEWAERSGIDPRTIVARLSMGWPPKRAVFDPARKGKRPWSS